MIRFLVRSLGFIIVAGAFVMLVIDATRSIAQSKVTFTLLGETAYTLFGERFLLLQPGIERHVHPLLWDPVVLNLLLLPTAFVGLVIGFALMWLGAKPREKVGFDTKR